MQELMKTGWLIALICGTTLFVVAGEAAAEGATWTPGFGSIRTDQKTDITLVSQEINLYDMHEITLPAGRAFAFHVKASFSVRNTSASKKKPTVLLPICTLSGRFDSTATCALDKSDLKIKVAGRTVQWTQSVKDNRLYARFSLKFGPRTERKIEVTYRIFERLAGRVSSGTVRNFATFDYHLEDSATWAGNVGATRFSIGLPFQATPFHAQVFSKGERFKYRNRYAYYEKRQLNPENDDGLSFYITTLSFKNRVDHSKKRVRARPKSMKRRIDHVNLLAAYPGARSEIVKNLAVVFNKRLRRWDATKRKHAVQVYTQYLIERHRFKDEGKGCDANICVENQIISDVIRAICSKNDECFETHRQKMNDCCQLGQS